MHHINFNNYSNASDLISGLQRSKQLRVSQRMRLDQENLAPIKNALFTSSLKAKTFNSANGSPCCALLVLAGHGRDPADDAKSLQMLHSSFVNYFTQKVSCLKIRYLFYQRLFIFFT